MKKNWTRSIFLYGGVTPKSLRVMKVAGVLLLTMFLQLSANTFSQNKIISVNVDNVTLTDLFKLIQKQSDFDFFFKPISVPSKKVTLNQTDTDINEVLKLALKGTNLDYKIVDTDIVIFEIDDNNPNKGTLQQQKVKVEGIVTDDDGEPLPGVNVFDKADPTHGVITDMNGNFSIEVQSVNSILVFSYIGFHTEEITINEPTNNLAIELKSEMADLDEVVVTALGIKKEEKMLGYAVQQVGNEELKEGGNPNVMSAMQGKIAGLEVNTASTGIGGSTKITIRGNSSIAGNNEPLWIVDGIPFNDNDQGGAPGTYGGYDRGSAASDLNMDDIESISVLKGPSAAALYGSRAGNGVIIVTTKRGSKKDGLGVEFTATYTVENVTETLNMQNKYGRGLNGVAEHNIYNNDGSKSSSLTSWGAEMDGSMGEIWNGETVPYSPQKNRMEDFFTTGVTQNYSLAIGNGDEERNYRFGTSYMKADGIIDNQSQERLNLDISGSTKLNKKISIDSKVSLAESTTNNRTYYGTYGIVNQLLKMPRNIRLLDLDPYSNEERNHINWSGGGPTVDERNPYYLKEQYINKEVRDRVFGFVKLNFEFGNLLNVAAKQSLDYYHTKFDDKRKDDGITKKGTEGSLYRIENRKYKQLNSEVLITGQKVFNKLDFSYVAGANRMHYANESDIVTEGNLKNNDFNISAGQNEKKFPTQGLEEKEVQSVFGSVQFYYNSFLNLEMTARNDWSSALPIHNNSYFYPSVNLGFIGTSLMENMGVNKPSWLSFAKLRLSWAKVGKDCDPHQLHNTKRYDRDDNGEVIIVANSDIRVNPDLKPEISTSREIGADIRLFNNRVGLDLTYYDTYTINQILIVEENKSSGFKNKYINAGKITNKGLELSMNLVPIKAKDFTWDLNLNYAHREDYVDELDSKNPNGEQKLGDNDMIKVIAKTGSPLGQIVAKQSFLRNENGDVIIDESTGLPQKLTGKEGEKVIGNIQPDWTGSVRSSFQYKNLSLSTLFNVKIGGDIVSVSESIATHAGTSKRTLNREGMIVDGVIDLGNGNYETNTNSIDAQNYYRTIGNLIGIDEEFLYDASYVKFGELSLSYTLSKKITSKLPIDHLRLSFIGRNLCYLHKNTPGTSPEVGFDMFSQAHDFSTIPYTKSFGFSINARF